ncbi:MAG TPA: sialidase family protein [Streptosporangiaceae bacterium]
MGIRRLRSKTAAVALMSLTLAATQGCTTTPGRTQPHITTQAPRTPPSVAAPQVTPMTKISAGCPGNSSEVEETFAPPSYVYAEWIGCGGIGFARSTDSGQHFAVPMTVPGSRRFSWDPAITVAADGTVYAAYMHAAAQASSTSNYPVVAVSHDHGLTFAQVHPDLPPVPGNWGDRDFIAAGPAGQLYLTWDYGPSYDAVKTLCAKGGSCAFSSGDLNTVIQTSSDGGATWGPITHLEPGFPLGGGYGAPLVARPDGSIDVLYNAHPTDQATEKLHPGYEYFASSNGGTNWPASPARLWPAQGTLSLTEWWIDGDISTDAAGDLYVTWDTQTAAGDIGWLTYSEDGGRTWSAPLRVTPDTDNAPHIVESAGGQPGVAYIAWQTSAPAQGYATYLRPFSIGHGWTGPAIKVSAAYGKAGIWPGDTFGISALPDGRISLTWGSAVDADTSAIYASVVKL